MRGPAASSEEECRADIVLDGVHTWGFVTGRNLEKSSLAGKLVDIIEPRHEKTNILHMQKQRRRSASRLPLS